jgi:hypothetical protein
MLASGWSLHIQVVPAVGGQEVAMNVVDAPLYKPRRRDIRRLLFLAFKHPFSGQEIVHDRHHIVADSLTEPGRKTSILLTFDQGTHASGWWRNSEYDRCLHLSLTHPPDRRLIADPNNLPAIQSPSDKEVAAWAAAVFGPHTDKLWIEPAASALDPYRRPNVPHIRLFLNRDNYPILPTGEVYTLKPWSDGSSPEKVFR